MHEKNERVAMAKARVFDAAEYLDGLQMIADELIEALSQSLRLLTSAGHELIVDGKRDVH